VSIFSVNFEFSSNKFVICSYKFLLSLLGATSLLLSVMITFSFGILLEFIFKVFDVFGIVLMESFVVSFLLDNFSAFFNFSFNSLFSLFNKIASFSN